MKNYMKKSAFLKKSRFILFLFCFLPSMAFAQGLIKGTVSDETGEPIIGASVKVLGTNTGAVTDVNGQTILYEYDGLGRLKSEKRVVNGVQAPEILHRYEYNYMNQQ